MGSANSIERLADWVHEPQRRQLDHGPLVARCAVGGANYPTSTRVTYGDLTDVRPELEQGLGHLIRIVACAMKPAQQLVDVTETVDGVVEHDTVDPLHDTDEMMGMIRHVLGQRWEGQA